MCEHAQDASSLEEFLGVAQHICQYVASVEPSSNPTLGLLTDELRLQVSGDCGG